MARYARGLICLTLTRERCRQLRLPLMVSDTNVDHRTNFTLSIEAAEGVTTGISAHDRAQTIRAAVRRDARPEDLRQPGHIFPLMAQPGGVLTRAGHTEAGCDLARLAGLEPAAVDRRDPERRRHDGAASGPGEVRAAAPAQDRHDRRPDPLPAGEGALGRAHRRAGRSQTEFGAFRMFCYEDHVNRTVHLALVAGELDGKRVPLVRVHLKDTLGDVVGIRDPRAGLAAALGDAAHRAGRSRRDRDPASGRDAARPDGRRAEHRSRSAWTPSPHAGAKVLRTYGIGAQILRDLGVTRMRVLSAPKQMHGLSGFDLEVVEYVDADPAPPSRTYRYTPPTIDSWKHQDPRRRPAVSRAALRDPRGALQRLHRRSADPRRGRRAAAPWRQRQADRDRARAGRVRHAAGRAQARAEPQLRRDRRARRRHQGCDRAFRLRRRSNVRAGSRASRRTPACRSHSAC